MVLLACSVLLAACGTTPKAPPRQGGYYQSDGPPEREPADLASVPDAVPRVEPLHPFANRPYVALGRNYAPLAADVAFRQRGMASWYGRQFHGNRTSSGEIYNMFAMTAAHPTLPLPSYVRVTSVKSGAAVIVRVNDRGPFKDDRIIDLSYAAATRLGFVGTGTGEVEIERFTNEQIAAGRCCEPFAAASQRASTPSNVAEPPATPAPAALAQVSVLPVPAFGATTTAALPDVAPQPAPPVIASPPLAPAPSEPAVSAAPTLPTAQRWSVQLGAFSQAGNAEVLRERVAALLQQSANAGLDSTARAPRVEQDGSIFRVLVGSLADRGAALQLARHLEQILNREASLFLR